MFCRRASFCAYFRAYIRAFFWAGLLVAYPGVALSAERGAASERLDVLIEEVREEFPQVQHISVDLLKTKFSDVVLLDVRDREEFEVSHLPGAIHAQGAMEIDAVVKAHPQKTVVFYCTVGLRSAIAARDFLARRETASEVIGNDPRSVAMKPLAVNLAGSIFAWVNAGGRLENAAGVTREVHPYSAWWGLRYLDDAQLSSD